MQESIKELEALPLNGLPGYIGLVVSLKNAAELSCQSTVHQKKTSHSCCNKYKGIRQKDIEYGLVIDKPGVYCFAEDLVFYATEEKKIAIKIDSDCVKLCFNGFSLSQGNNVSGGVGLQVLGCYDNITIEGGTIKDFTQNGTCFAGAPICNLTMNNMHVVNCGNEDSLNSSGVLAVGLQEFVVENSQFLKNYGSGVALFEVKDFTMRSTKCNQTKGVEGINVFPFDAAQGLLIFGVAPFIKPSENMLLENCSFNGTTNKPNAYGMFVANSSFQQRDPDLNLKNLTIRNCECIGSVGTLDDFNRPRLFNAPFPEANGAQIIGVSNLVVTGSVFSKNCTETTVVLPAEFDKYLPTAIGLQVGASTDVFVENSVAQGNCSTEDFEFPVGNDNFARSRGFSASAMVNGHYKNCTALGNTVHGEGQNDKPTIMSPGSRGFRARNYAGENVGTGSKVVFENCVARGNNGIDSGNIKIGQWAVGFEIFGQVEVIDCESIDQSGTGDHILTGAGYMVSGLVGAGNNNIMLSGCLAKNNQEVGFFGNFADVASSGIEILKNNCAISNGDTHTIATDNNYAALPKNTPIEMWNFSGGEAVPGQKTQIDNMSVF